LGSPGKVVREITEKDLELLQMSSEHYVQRGKEFKEILK
jgi:carbonic anhydrase/acetyltransferase-like protein (isoleucine patch superfamily)